MQFVTFGAGDNANTLASYTPKQLDDLAFGVVQIDRTGEIHLYNSTEGQMFGIAPDSVIGKNFFTEVALCMNKPEFRDRFEDGVRSGDLNVVFEWYLGNGHQGLAQVHLRSAIVEDRYWVFIKRL